MKTHLILETGCNHQGDMKIAKQMIETASYLGAWGIKFQKRDIEAIPDHVKIKQRNLDNSFGVTYYEHRKALEFTKAEMKELILYSRLKGLEFVCSAFDKKSIEDLFDIGCKYIKLPSQLYTREDLRKLMIYCREDNPRISLMVSTGMHEEDEILNNPWIEIADIIFHCISVYPCATTKMNLMMIRKLNKAAKGYVGYSSHEHEGFGIKYAVMCGADYIERHFTLNKEWKGSDHGTVSSDCAEVKRIITDIENAERILGDLRKPSKKEKIVRKIYRGF